MNVVQAAWQEGEWTGRSGRGWQGEWAEGAHGSGWNHEGTNGQDWQYDGYADGNQAFESWSEQEQSPRMQDGGTSNTASHKYGK